MTMGLRDYVKRKIGELDDIDLSADIAWEYVKDELTEDLPRFFRVSMSLLSRQGLKDLMAFRLPDIGNGLAELAMAGIEFVFRHGRPTKAKVEPFLRERGILR